MIDDVRITSYDIVCETNGEERVVGVCYTEKSAEAFCVAIQEMYEFASRTVFQCSGIRLPEPRFIVREITSVF